MYFIKESKHDTIFTSKYNGKLQKLCDKLQYLHMIGMIRRGGGGEEEKKILDRYPLAFSISLFPR